LINTREKEMEDNIENIRRENAPDTTKEELQRLKNLIKTRNSECDNLNNNLKICMEEKKILINKVNDLQLKLDSNKRYGFSDSYMMGVDSNEKYMDKKSVNKYIDKVQKQNKEYLKKKKYYKEQCKLFNQVIEVIMKMLTKEQVKQIEKFDAYQTLMNNNLKYNNINDNNIMISKEMVNSNEGIKISNDNLNNINNSSNKKGNNNYVYNYNSNNIFGENNNLFNNKNDSGAYNNSNKNIINNNSNAINNNKVFNNNNNNIFNNNNNNLLDNKFNNNVFGNNNINTDNSNKGKTNNNDNEEIEENISYSESLAQN
jgi:hypothetical protein